MASFTSFCFSFLFAHNHANANDFDDNFSRIMSKAFYSIHMKLESADKT